MFPMTSLAVIAFSMAIQTPPSLADLSWLAGRWVGSTGTTDTEEIWMAPAAGVMIGMHRDVSRRGPYFHEFLMIRESADGIEYVASPRGASTTAFPLTDGGTSHAVFTNPDHDFPQRIEYRLTDDGRLYVSIAGGGREAGQSWIWRREALSEVSSQPLRRSDTSYVVLPPAREIALARSAAPATVSMEATIWVLVNGRYTIAVEGANQNHCFVARTWPESLEPVCYDAEASRTILPIEIRRFDLRRQGFGRDRIDSIVNGEIGEGVLQVPRRPAMSYMMSSGQVLFGDNGEPAGNWRPHLMLYMPYVTLEELGAANGPTGEFMVVNAGDPTAYLMVVVPQFVDPQPDS